MNANGKASPGTKDVAQQRLARRFHAAEPVWVAAAGRRIATAAPWSRHHNSASPSSITPPCRPSSDAPIDKRPLFTKAWLMLTKLL